MNLFDLLSYAFIQRATAAGLITAALLAILGVFVNLRKMAFFGEGIAHASLAGVAIGLLVHQEPIIWACLYSLLFATAVYLLEKKTALSADSLIGILFTSSLALGVLLIHARSGYQPDLISYLFGNILTVSLFDLVMITSVTFIVGAFFLWQFRAYLLLSLNAEMAHVAGLKTEWLTFILYLAMALSAVIGIKILGIVLVSALLIIPTATAKLFASSAKSLLVTSVIFAECAILLGIAASLAWNLPTGACIILAATALFLASTTIRLSHLSLSSFFS